jgi:hypothetical protein
VSPSGEFLCIHFKNDAIFSGACDGSTRYQIIYITQHIKFQMYMLNALIERLGSDVEDSHNLIRDDVYQEHIESKLKMIINRHCDLIR